MVGRTLLQYMLITKHRVWKLKLGVIGIGFNFKRNYKALKVLILLNLSRVNITLFNLH